MYITRVKGECQGSYSSYYASEEDHRDLYSFAHLGFMESEDPDDGSEGYLAYCWPKELKEFFSKSESRFEYNNKENTLYVIVDYYSETLPTPEQAKDITNYTQGQWSDGIGEGYEQRPILVEGYQEDLEFYISMWYRGQEPETTIHQTSLT